jgi:hypothetical protein
VHGYFHIRFPEREAPGRFVGTEPFEPCRADRVGLLVGQRREQPGDIGLRVAGFLVAVLDQHVVEIPDRDKPALTAEPVDHLVARDGEQPPGEGAVRVVGRAALVDRDQGFLHEILDVFLAPVHPPPVKGAQDRQERAQQRIVGRGVARQPSDHPCPELVFVCPHIVSRPAIRGDRRDGYRQEPGCPEIFS